MNIFGTELQSEGAGPYGPVFLNGLQKRPRSGPDRTVASLLPMILCKDVSPLKGVVSHDMSLKLCQLVG